MNSQNRPRTARNRATGLLTPRGAVSVAIALVVLIGIILIPLTVSGGSGEPDAVIGTPESTEGLKVAEVPVETEEVTEAPANDVPVTEEVPSSGEYTVIFAFYGKKNVTCKTDKTTVGELAEKLGITFAEGENPSVPLETVIDGDLYVTVDSTETETETEYYVIDYETEYVDTDELYEGESETERYGVEGQGVIEYRCTYVNGELVNREEISRSVVSEPVNMIVKNGTRVRETTPPSNGGGNTGGGTVVDNGGGTLVGGDGVTYHYSSYIDVMATVYYQGGTTASGLPADENVIAVDPTVIGLGTNVYITGAYADVGVRIAADTGGDIKGNKIDICINPATSPLANFGWQPMRVYILD